MGWNAAFVWVALLSTRMINGVSHYPVADQSAVVTAGKGRFTVLTPQLLRLEWDQSSHFRDASTMTVVNRHLPVPAYNVTHDGDWIVVTTSHLQLRYLTTSPRSFFKKNVQVSLLKPPSGKDPLVWEPNSSVNDDRGRLPGTIRTLDGIDGYQDLNCHGKGYRKDLHCTLGVISHDGFVVLDDTNDAEFDASPWPWVVRNTKPMPLEASCSNVDPTERRQCGTVEFNQADCGHHSCCFDAKTKECFYSSTGKQDLYFLGHGHEYKKALKEFTLIAGPIPIPPRFSFGVFFSKYWPFNDVGVLDSVVESFQKRTVPLDVVVIDMDWHKTFYSEKVKDQAGQPKGWTGFTWDKTLFPDPQQFISRLHSFGLKVTLNLHPASGVQKWEDSYEKVAKLMGIDPKSGNYVPFRITNPKFAEVWLNDTLGLREAEGVDFWWLDWQQGEDWLAAKEDVHTVSPTLWLNYVFSTNPNKWHSETRPVILHRWGGFGNHRYPLGFSGDVVVSWKSLEYQPYFTAMAANVGYGYWSHDIGGNSNSTGAELYTRWVQWGAFSPVFRTHCTKNPNIHRRIWMYDHYYANIMHHAITRRTELLPYVYTEVWRTHTSGLSLLRGLYFDFPEAQEAYKFSGQYMFGESLMVAPITSPINTITGLAIKQVWVPPGNWIDLNTGTKLTGSKVMSGAYTLNEVPLFAPAGTVIPMSIYSGGRSLLLGQSQLLPTVLKLFVVPGAQLGSGELYEDDGISVRYARGKFATSTFHYEYDEGFKSVQFTVDPQNGTFEGMLPQRSYKVEFFASWPAQSVSINGKEVQFWSTGRGDPPQGTACWTYEGRMLSLSVYTKAISDAFSLSVKFSLPNNDPRLLSGFVGTAKRLQEAKVTLDGSFGQVYMDLYPTLVTASATASRITYNPTSVETELAAFGKLCAAGADEVSKLEKLDATVKQMILAQLSCSNVSESPVPRPLPESLSTL